MSCLFNPGPCIQTAIENALLGVPWWAWVLIIVLTLALVWKLLGWPGVIAAAAGIGFLFGRFPSQAKRAFDQQNDNSSDFWPPSKPKPPVKKVSDDWKKRMGME